MLQFGTSSKANCVNSCLLMHIFQLLGFQVNSVNCNTSWKVVLFMKWSDNKETILKGVGNVFGRTSTSNNFYTYSTVHAIILYSLQGYKAQ